MRFNLRRLMLLSGGVIITWLLVSFLFMLEGQKIQNTLKDPMEIEFELSKLQVQMDHQLNDTYSLLQKLQHIASKQDILQKNRLGVDKVKPNQYQSQKKPPVIPVLVIACNRITVQKSLDSLIRYRPNKETFPIIVSQDCGHNATYRVIKKYVDSDPSIHVIRQPDLSEIPRVKRSLAGYYKIARHFKFALDHVLVKLFYNAVIIIEDDLDVSPDMFHYFLGTYPLLQEDPSIWCISAWNDNGKKEQIELTNPSLLHRTDFFPGLGWMLRREAWLELQPIWPKAYFDDWLRDPKNVKNRVCIRPEISRTYSFGKYGVSQGMFFDKHLKHIHLNEQFVDFTKLNLSYLLKHNYDANLKSLMASLPVSPAHLAAQATSDVKVMYRDEKSFKAALRRFELMEDFRSGIARTAYRGIVSCYINNHRIYLAPDFNWTSYNSSWR